MHTHKLLLSIISESWAGDGKIGKTGREGEGSVMLAVMGTKSGFPWNRLSIQRRHSCPLSALYGPCASGGMQGKEGNMPPSPLGLAVCLVSMGHTQRILQVESHNLVQLTYS